MWNRSNREGIRHLLGTFEFTPLLLYNPNLNFLSASACESLQACAALQARERREPCGESSILCGQDSVVIGLWAD